MWRRSKPTIDESSCLRARQPCCRRTDGFPGSVECCSNSMGFEFLLRPWWLVSKLPKCSQVRFGIRTSPSTGACSSTVTECPHRAKAIAAASPPNPAPTTMMFSGTTACRMSSKSASRLLFVSFRVVSCLICRRNCRDWVGYDGDRMPGAIVTCVLYVGES